MDLFRVLVRLAQFKDSGYRILLQGGETSNSDKTSNVSDTDPAGMGNPGRIGGYDPSNLEGRALSALNMFAQNAKMTSEHMWVRRTSSSSPGRDFFFFFFNLCPLSFEFL